MHVLLPLKLLLQPTTLAGGVIFCLTAKAATVPAEASPVSLPAAFRAFFKTCSVV